MRGYPSVAWLLAPRLGSRALHPAADPPSHLLHVDADAVCPRCLRWVEPDDFVRRTALGPVQHEVCPDEPPARARQVVRR